MNKRVATAAFCLSAGLFIPAVYAQLPGLSGGSSPSESSFTSEQSEPPATVPPSTSAPSPSKNKRAGNAGPNTSHTLDEIMFKVSRAQINLEQMGNDYNGHGTKAIDYLKKAMEELQAAKQSP